MVDHPPNQRVMFTNQARDVQDRHDFGKLHDKSLKQQGESAVRSGPRDRHPANTATGAVNTGSSGMETGFMLEEVQVAPSQFVRIVCLGSRSGQAKVEPRAKSK
jgi:hypothetical protein